MKEVWHYRDPKTLRIACGEQNYLPNQGATDVRENVTCVHCKAAFNMGSAIFCDHANEAPASPWCKCPPDCYCWTHTCSAKAAVLADVRETRCLAECEDRVCGEWGPDGKHEGPHRSGALFWTATDFWWRGEEGIGLHQRRCAWCASLLSDGCTWSNCSQRPRPQKRGPWTQYGGTHLPWRKVGGSVGERIKNVEASAHVERLEGKLASAEAMERELAPRLELMRWTLGRPDVLSLLETLRAGIEGGGDLSRMLRAIGLGFDLHAREQQRESAECEPPDDTYRRWECKECGTSGGSRGYKKFCSYCDAAIVHCAPLPENAGKDWFVPVGLKHEVGDTDYAQMISPIDSATVGGAEVAPTVEELLAPSLQVEKAWEGRVCALCGEVAVGEAWMWGIGVLPICARHGKGG